MDSELSEAQELLAAIKSGAVDAFVTEDQRVFSVKNADYGYRLLVETMNEGAATLLEDGTIMYFNKKLSMMLKEENIAGKSIFEYVAESDRIKLRSILAQGKSETVRAELSLMLKKGSLPVLLSCHCLKLEGIEYIGMVITDLKEQKCIQKAAITERQRLFEVLEMLPAYVILLDNDYRVPFANRFFRERFGESNGKRCYEYLFSRTEPCEDCKTYDVLKKGERQHFEWKGPDNKIYDVHDFPFVDSDGKMIILEMGIDITDQKIAQDWLKLSRDRLEEQVEERTRELKKLLNEKEALLKEVHHRVKNNLQMISSLIRMQSRRINNDQAKKALEDGQNRIRSMALVHEILCRSESFSSPDLNEYLQRIALDLIASYKKEDKNIKIELSVDKVPLGIDIVIPCGLIVNELVSNSLKYAFNERNQGNISIILKDKKGKVDLIVKDDGIGLPQGFNEKDTLGLQLINIFTQQIEGSLQINVRDGTEVRVEFPNG